MSPFDVVYRSVPDERLSALLASTNNAGFPTPEVLPVLRAGNGASAADSRPLAVVADLPSDWHLVRRLEGQTYSWPELREHYVDYAIYAGKTRRDGTVHIALGRAERLKTWGRDRTYIIAFLTSGTPQAPLVEFLETDDYPETHEMLAVIRGRDGAESKKMFGPGDSLPEVYVDRFRTGMYNDYIRVQGSWNKVAVIASEDDSVSMLNHALLQARRRGNL
jgi:hypothetical protein